METSDLSAALHKPDYSRFYVYKNKPQETVHTENVLEGQATLCDKRLPESEPQSCKEASNSDLSENLSNKKGKRKLEESDTKIDFVQYVPPSVIKVLPNENRIQKAQKPRTNKWKKKAKKSKVV